MKIITLIKKIVLYIFPFLFSINLFSQPRNPQIEGYVFSDNKPLPGASVIIIGTSIGTKTNKEGYYKLENLPRGPFSLKASSIGYVPQEIEVKLKGHQTQRVDFDLKPEVLKMGNVVVTGTKTEHYIKDVPVRTEVITEREIESKNACNLYEALAGLSGIRVEQQCQYCNFSMVRMQGLGSEHTQVLIDGQPIYSGLAGVYGLQQMGTEDVSQIEVVKGAGSALYGSGAIAGAINIITKEPSSEPSTNIDIQFGNYNTNRYNILSSLRNKSGNIGAILFAQKSTGNAIDETGPGITLEEVKQKDGISDRVASNLINAGFSLFVNNAIFNNEKIILRGKYISERRYGGTIINDYFKNPFTDGTENIFTDRYEVQLNYDKKFSHSSILNFSAAYVLHNREATNDTYLMDYMDTHNGLTPDIREMRPYLANEDLLSFVLTFNHSLANHNFLAGIQFMDNLYDESGMYVVVDPTSSYYGKSYKSIANKSAKDLGLFLQDEWSITEKLMFVPGIRADKHISNESYSTDRQVFDFAFPQSEFDKISVNPRLAIKYDLSESIILRTNFGTGFRAPYGFSEDLHLCSGSPRIWKSSSLKPETSMSYNFSADYYGSFVTVSANVFRTDLKNKIGFNVADKNVAALGYDYQWENIDDAFVQGIELAFQLQVLSNLNLTISSTLNQGKYYHPRADWVGTEYESISKYIPRFPSTTGDFTIEFAPKNWQFSLRGSLQGAMYIDYYSEDPLYTSKIKKTNPFMLFNASASRKFDMFKIYGGIDNIFNYVQDERHLDDAAFMYAPIFGRMYYLGVSLELKH